MPGAPYNLLDMLEVHEAAMTDSWSFLNNRPKNLELIVIEPQSPLRSRVFSS